MFWDWGNAYWQSQNVLHMPTPMFPGSLAGCCTTNSPYPSSPSLSEIRCGRSLANSPQKPSTHKPPGDSSRYTEVRCRY